MKPDNASEPVVLLDLDGTLIDSGPGVLACAADAFRAVGRPVPPVDVLRGFVGPPIRESLRGCGVPDDELDAAVAGFRADFAERSITGSALYPGVLDALGELRRAGCRLAIATSKPSMYAEAVCRHFGIADLVDGIFGAPGDSFGKSKTGIVADALAALGAGCAVMVGDRSFDVVAARDNGLDCLGVAWGYAPAGELAGAGVVEVVARPRLLGDSVAAYFETHRGSS